MTYLHKSKIPPIPNFYLVLIDLELAATFIIGTHLYARYLFSRALGLGQAHATIGYLVCCIKNYRPKFLLGLGLIAEVKVWFHVKVSVRVEGYICLPELFRECVKVSRVIMEFNV